MKKFFVAATLAALYGVASAQCAGSASSYSCYDATGNSYMVNKIGNTTMVTGSNAATGSLWSQQSSRIGNSTFTTGQTNGRTWNETTTSTGSSTTSYGSNSRGQLFMKTCTAAGCF